MEAQSRIYGKVEGSIDETGYDIGPWEGGQLIDVGFRVTPGYGKRMYLSFRDLANNKCWGLEFDRGVEAKVYMKIGDLDLTTKQCNKCREFILTEDNMKELKKIIEDSKV